MVRGTFSPARAWRPTVGARLARTLVLTGTSVGAPPAKTAFVAIPNFAASPDFPLSVPPSVRASLMTFLRPTTCQNQGDCVQSSHVSFVTLSHKTR
ncbi:hypothetical protein RA210_U280024 [Rubrivivax sp. A210]|nr:hypothetical protein RA210_U280024 [Rubrivivax sp. A210]